MAIVSNLDLLRRVPFFSMLSDAQAEVVAASLVKQRFRRGQLLLAQDRPCPAFYIILSGRVRVLISDERGREVIFATLGTGDYIGEMSIIDESKASASVRAEVQTDVLSIPRESFLRFLPDPGSIAYGVLRGLVARLRKADKKIESLALMDVYDRVKSVLRDLAEPIEGEWIIKSRVSRQDLAKMVGASREMVSRVMKELENAGFFKTLDDGSLRLRSEGAVAA